MALFRCPDCRVIMRLDDHQRGDVLPCPECGAKVRIPRPKQENPQPPGDPLPWLSAPAPAPPPPAEDPPILDVIEVADEDVGDEEEILEVVPVEEAEGRQERDWRAAPPPRRHEEPVEVVEVEPDRPTGPDDRPRRRKKKRRQSLTYPAVQDRGGGGGLSIGFLEDLFTSTNFVVLLIFAFCCTPLAVPIGLLGCLFTREPDARRNALTVLLLGIAWAVFATVLNLAITKGR
jgi:hypothetical protein